MFVADSPGPSLAPAKCASEVALVSDIGWGHVDILVLICSVNYSLSIEYVNVSFPALSLLPGMGLHTMSSKLFVDGTINLHVVWRCAAVTAC